MATLLRPETDPPLRLDQANSQFGGCRLAATSGKSEVRRDFEYQTNPDSLDTIPLDFESPVLADGAEQDGEIVLHWKGNPIESRVPLHVQIHPAWEPALRQVFCGHLSPGQIYTTLMPILGTERNQIQVDQVAAEANWIAGQIENNTIVLKIQAPPSTGRFSEDVTIGAEDGTSTKIVVTGLAIDAKE